MERCIPIPGMLHITRNVAKSVTAHMPNWDSFYSQLKNIAGLLSVPDRCRLVFDACIRGTRYAAIEKVFLQGTPKLYEARWGVVRDFLRAARPL
eukprot:9954747-Alexandrium_andersonii.AAC.1